MNTVREVKEFIIKYLVDAVLENAHCEIKHGRTIEGLMEYLKYAPVRLQDLPPPDKLHKLREMIVDYFGSEKGLEHDTFGTILWQR